MLKKLNKFRPIIALITALVVFVIVITTVLAAYRFQKTVVDDDVIIGNITDVSKS